MELISVVFASLIYAIGLVVFCTNVFTDPYVKFSNKDKAVVILLSFFWPIVTVVYLLNK